MKHFDIGYPTTFGSTHLGLYQPVLDCFLMTLSDRQQAQEIKLLASARYSLFIIDLQSSANYAPNMIDNECCENWTFTNKTDIDVGAPFSASKTIFAKELIKSNANDPDIGYEKAYLQTILYYVKLCLNLISSDHYQIDKFINEVMDLEDSQYQSIKNFVIQTKKILYTNKDLDVIEKNMQTYMLYYHKNFPQIKFPI